MNRRSVLTALGVATASTLSVGSGAFTSVNADRSITIDTAGDRDALLGLIPLDNEGPDGRPTGRVADSFGSEVYFSIPGIGPGESDNVGGVGTDSEYVFNELLRVVNQGSQAVVVQTEYNGDEVADLALTVNGRKLRDDPPKLQPGSDIEVGLFIDTHGSSTGEYDEILTIIADQPGE